MYTNKEIWNVSYPIFLGLLAQNIINVTDTAFLGRVGGARNDTGRDILAGIGGAHVWADTSFGPIHCPLAHFI